MPIVGFYTNFSEDFPKEWRKSWTSWKRLLITFWRRQVKKSIVDHFVAVTMHLLRLGRNKCQLLDFIQILQRIFQESEEKVELHEERLLTTFWRRQVGKSMIAHFVAVIIYLLGFCRNEYQFWILYKFFREFSKRVKKKLNFMKTFVNNFLKTTS